MLNIEMREIEKSPICKATTSVENTDGEWNGLGQRLVRYRPVKKRLATD
jgi:hypothetical protein